MKTDEEIKSVFKKQFERDTMICPVCEEYQFENLGDCCLVRGWEHDVAQSYDFNEDWFVNRLSLNRHKAIFKEMREDTIQMENDSQKMRTV